MKGVAITNFSVLLQAINWLALKYAFILYPGLNGAQVILARCIVSSIVTFLYVNKDIKKAMWTELEPGSIPLIGFRSLTEVILRGSMYTAMKYFTLTTFAIFNNCSPLVTLLLAAAILKENVTCFDYSTVLLGLCAVSLITYGMTQKQEVSTSADEASTNPKKYAQSDHFSLFPFLAMIAVPLMFGIQHIIARKMRKFKHASSMSCY